MEQQELLKLIIVILAIGGLIALLGGILTLISNVFSGEAKSVQKHGGVLYHRFRARTDHPIAGRVSDHRAWRRCLLLAL